MTLGNIHHPEENPPSFPPGEQPCLTCGKPVGGKSKARQRCRPCAAKWKNKCHAKWATKRARQKKDKGYNPRTLLKNYQAWSISTPKPMLRALQAWKRELGLHMAELGREALRAYLAKLNKRYPGVVGIE